MGAQSLGSRAIIGEFYKKLSQDTGDAWINPTSMLFNTQQASEDYKWLGQVPQMREWVGGRHAKTFTENSLTITNSHYEGTMEVLLREMNRDHTGQVMIRIAELAKRSNSHWAKLLTDLIAGGAAATCYDGQYFFDTDHVEGNNVTSQSNDLAVDISAFATSATSGGTTTAPSVEEAQATVMTGIAAILGFKDNENEPMNSDARSFIVMVPMSLYIAFSTAFQGVIGDQNTKQALPPGFQVDVVANPRIADGALVYLFRTDGNVKPLIRQQETAVNLKVKAEGSDFEFDNDAHQYGVDAWRAVGYGYWQHACLMTMG